MSVMLRAPPICAPAGPARHIHDVLANLLRPTLQFADFLFSNRHRNISGYLACFTALNASSAMSNVRWMSSSVCAVETNQLWCEVKYAPRRVHSPHHCWCSIETFIIRYPQIRHRRGTAHLEMIAMGLADLDQSPSSFLPLSAMIFGPSIRFSSWRQASAAAIGPAEYQKLPV